MPTPPQNLSPTAAQSKTKKVLKCSLWLLTLLASLASAALAVSIEFLKVPDPNYAPKIFGFNMMVVLPRLLGSELLALLTIVLLIFVFRWEKRPWSGLFYLFIGVNALALGPAVPHFPWVARMVVSTSWMEVELYPLFPIELPIPTVVILLTLAALTWRFPLRRIWWTYPIGLVVIPFLWIGIYMLLGPLFIRR